MMQNVLPISAVLPTRDRPLALHRALDSLAAQSCIPAELIIVDGSTDLVTRKVVEEWANRVASRCVVIWEKAKDLGAAVQRHQGILASTQPFLWFFEDDIIFEPECVERLWNVINSDSQIGGVNAMIVNQRYHPPGLPSRLIFILMHGRREESFAGRVIGPAINLLPEDNEDLPAVVPVEWLNLGCTMYRREALPSPPFDSIFSGYSLMEDLALSLKVGRSWKLANVRTARIYHDSQRADYKSDVADLARMQLVNRHYVMTEILHRRRIGDYLRLIVWELFQLAVCGACSRSRRQVSATCSGKFQALHQIVNASLPRPTRTHVELPAAMADGKPKS
jgi:glycosyltransferase involved in cell wall biosynthesis